MSSSTYLQKKYIELVLVVLDVEKFPQQVAELPREHLLVEALVEDVLQLLHVLHGAALVQRLVVPVHACRVHYTPLGLRR